LAFLKIIRFEKKEAQIHYSNAPYPRTHKKYHTIIEVGYKNLPARHATWHI
jgi:hypothetical protein